MFPRVLGNWLGRIAGQVVETCERFHESFQRFQNNNETQSYRPAIRDALLVAFVPGGAAFVASHYMIRAAAQLNRALQNRQAGPHSGVNPTSTPIDKGLSCYLEAVAESDPLLISPFGTMPIERCLGR